MRFVIYRDTGGFWFWHLEDEAGWQLAYGSESFANADDATHAVRRIADGFGAARIDILPSDD